MRGRLNVDRLKSALRSAGLNQARLAENLDVSREAVSKWFSGESLPRPDKLLRLALTLRCSIEDLVLDESATPEPVVFFRKKSGQKITDGHIEKAREIGWALRPLVECLPFDALAKPQTLKQPSADYDYIQTVAERVRTDLGLKALDVLDFSHLIDQFRSLQAVLIPVLWGKKDKHENAWHIYLSDTFTTWIHLNLDSEIHDFKFWMAHEFGHVLAPDMERDAAEDFADAFAGALLFPREAAKHAYLSISSLRSKSMQINRIKQLARDYVISPVSVYFEANNFANAAGLEPLDLEPAIYGAAQNLHKEFQTVREILFGQGKPSARDYIRICADTFGTPFFDCLSKYLETTGQSASYVRNVLQVSMADAKEIYAELLNGAKPDIGR